MKYEDFYCSNEYAIQPDWIEVALSEKDKDNIKIAKALLKDDLVKVEFNFHGTVDWEGDARLKIWQLIVTPYSVWFGCVDDDADAVYEVQLTEDEL